MRLDMELRVRELNRLKEEKRSLQDAEEKRIKEEQGAVPSTLQEQHRRNLQDIDDIMK
jgi:hypothetical protein